MTELRWYLETFLDYPFSPFTERAERIQASLQQWGTLAFKALFGDKQSGRLFDAATSQQYSELHLEIASDDPAILHWPWEALRDPEVGVLSRTCQMSRRLNQVRDPHPISDELPKDGINILLVTARPYDSDVQFRSISRPLVELIAENEIPATVTLLRPPTIEKLNAHLAAHPNHYHILHFDGHGSYGSTAVRPSQHTLTLKGLEGQLIFEDADGKPDPQSASVLSELLRQYKIPTVVLNACQSAMVDHQADDAFASVAAGLQKSGVRSVVAMAYSLYVSGAQQFLQAFYRRLFATGGVAEATRSGRQQAFLRPERVCARGRFPLGDWLVPVLYEQQAVNLKFDRAAAPNNVTSKAETSSIPDEALDSRNPYGFIGRDGAILELERSLHRPPAGVLIHGLGGIGKTTLCRGFIKWLADTNGLPLGCIWLSFQEIRSAEYVINHLVGTLFSTNALAASTDQKLRILIQALRSNPFLIVWDNFEVVRGDANKSMVGSMSEADQLLLADLLHQLRGGKTKVLITSRSDEPWLETSSCFRLPIRGLSGEERWEFCDTIVKDFGLTIDCTKDDWQELIDMLDGHPLMMRVVLSQLQHSSPAQLLAGLKENLGQFVGLDAESAKLFATLRFVSEGLPEDLRRWLIPVSLHERFVDADYLKEMAKGLMEANSNTNSEVDKLILVLSSAGLLSGIGGGIFELHPALSRYLRQCKSVDPSLEEFTAWQRGFTDFMGYLAGHYGDQDLHNQRLTFHIHGGNFHRARELAADFQMTQPQIELTVALGLHATNTARYKEAIDLFYSLTHLARRSGRFELEAWAYLRLGSIAQEQRDFVTAEQWFRKSLAIAEKRGYEDSAANSYHHLGMIAQEQRDFATADQCFRKSLATREKRGNESAAAKSYHHLGIIAQEEGDFATADQWLRKSLAIKEKQGDEHGAAITYHQLGRNAEEQRDFATANQYYRKSLAISEKQGNEHFAAGSYLHLGIIAEEQGDFATAEQWCRKSLSIYEKRSDEHGAANCYHQMGVIAGEQRDFATAEQWYRKSLAIWEKQENEHSVAGSYRNLGMVAQEQGDFETAGQWYRKSLAIAEKRGDEDGAAGCHIQFGRIAKKQRDFAKAEQCFRKSLSIYEKRGDKQGVANCYHHLGMIAQEERDFAKAEQWYRKSLAINEKLGNDHDAAMTYAQLGLLALLSEQQFEAGQWMLKAIAVFQELDPCYAEKARMEFRIIFNASTESEQQLLRELWQIAKLGAFPPGDSK
jgi:tetratricopeptide (TPR) repeat protein